MHKIKLIPDGSIFGALRIEPDDGDAPDIAKVFCNNPSMLERLRTAGSATVDFFANTIEWGESCGNSAQSSTSNSISSTTSES